MMVIKDSRVCRSMRLVTPGSLSWTPASWMPDLNPSAGMIGLVCLFLRRLYTPLWWCDDVDHKSRFVVGQCRAGKASKRLIDHLVCLQHKFRFMAQNDPMLFFEQSQVKG